jgi:Large ribosomal RNA subunit accumulation protein YceD
MTPLAASIWPRPVLAAKFGPKPSLHQLVADDAERVAIARAYGCLIVERLEADLKINRRGDQLRIIGKLKADVVQPCVVTLEPVPARIREEVSFAFAPPVSTREARAEEAEDVAYEGEDPPETLIEGEADLGAVLLQFFALALDPYPRKADAALTMPEQPDLTHPFAALKGLKRDG